VRERTTTTGGKRELQKVGRVPKHFDCRDGLHDREKQGVRGAREGMMGGGGGVRDLRKESFGTGIAFRNGSENRRSLKGNRSPSGN